MSKKKKKKKVYHLGFILNDMENVMNSLRFYFGNGTFILCR